MDVTVYTPVEDCVACRQTKRRLDRLGISFSEIVADDERAEALRRDGFRAWPVVMVSMGGASWSWSGYRHDDITRLAHLFG